MKQIIREHLVDCSDREVFCFSLTCPECGTVWKSSPTRFSKAREKPQSESKRIIFETLYQREQMQALTRALDEAVYHFNLCPFCKRIICNNCFLICDDLDMCRSCAEQFQEDGEKVSCVGQMNG